MERGPRLRILAAGPFPPADGGPRAARMARTDRLCALALHAAAAALQDAGPGDPDRTAVLLGTAYGCHATDEEYYRGLVQGGRLGASPRLFSYTLPSSPVGEIAIQHGLRGPAHCRVDGPCAGLAVVADALRLLRRGRAGRALVVAAETAFPGVVHNGAAALLVDLEHARSASAPCGYVSQADTAFCDRDPEQALRRLLWPGDRLLCDPHSAAVLGASAPITEYPAKQGAVGGLQELLQAHQHAADRVLILASDESGQAAAVFWERE